MGKRTVSWLGALALFFVVGCGGGGGEQKGQTTTAQKKQPAKKAAAVDPATAATITGKVMFAGTAPQMTVIDVSSEATCQEHAQGSPVYTENVIVNDNGTLKNVFVFVKEGLGDREFPPPSTPVVLDQVGCQYHPHVFGIQAKQPLVIKNSDEGVLHNIHTFSKKGNSFNFGMPKVMESTKEFKKAEQMVRIKCDVHGWMGAWAGVVDNPYYAVTGADGAFKLANLPPGNYVIEAWHEEYGSKTQSVTIGAKEMKDITFTFEPAS